MPSVFWECPGCIGRWSQSAHGVRRLFFMVDPSGTKTSIALPSPGQGALPYESQTRATQVAFAGAAITCLLSIVA
eukprot:12936684-Prorocentrum_lima.AAC.1